MKQTTLNLIHRSFEKSIDKSANIIDVTQNFHDILKDQTVDNEDAETFELFINNLKSHYCI